MSNPVSITERLLKPEEVADILHVSVKTLAHWRSGQVSRGPAYIRAGIVLYDRKDLEEWIVKNRVAPEE